MAPLRPSVSVFFALLLCSVSWVSAQDSDNLCDQPGEAPDVIVGELGNPASWGTIGDIHAFSFETWSCNIGTCWLNWLSSTNEHPVIGQNLYRLRENRFEQLGQSWLKHGFFALSDELCSSPCVPTNGDHLGVNCADPYTAGLNAEQSGLGAKFEVNPATGVFAYPYTGQGLTGDAIYKRLQVHDEDLDPAQNIGALYFIESHYVTADDAAARNQDNNASYRQVTVSVNGTGYELDVQGETQRAQPAIAAWQAIDPAVFLTETRAVGDGAFQAASRATDLGNGFWQYEYAVHNLNSHRAAGSFRVPFPPGTAVRSFGFHDVDYHSGEPFDGTDWCQALDQESPVNAVTWATDAYDENPLANALRWSTLYNFRFEADAPPALGNVTLGMFRPGTPDSIKARAYVPDPCVANGVCSPGETCTNCPVDCSDQGGGGGCCGDDTCDPGEDPCSCPDDCAGPCEVPCAVPADCDDDIFCNGQEQCVGDVCVPGVEPCGGGLCTEAPEACPDCLVDCACDDGLFCNGDETCDGNECVLGAEPCPGEMCDEQTNACVGCDGSGPCSDGIFCNGQETCDGDQCIPGAAPCSGLCDEDLDLCAECLSADDCTDGWFCNGIEICATGVCEEGEQPCRAGYCEESLNTCVEVQTRPGEPLRDLTGPQLDRFLAGQTAFRRVLTEGDGLGPGFNATSCTACHSNPDGGWGETTVQWFGDSGGLMEDLGGPVLQTQAVSPSCQESLPPEATLFTVRSTPSLLGSGLIEAIPDADLEALALDPPAGTSGRIHLVSPLESTEIQIPGRFGWRSQEATLLSFAARDSLDHLGRTSRLLPDEHAPNGDPVLLAQCDDQQDPEDGPDAAGFDSIDRIADFLRYLAPPPQTPRSNTNGELFFLSSGCGDCHRPSMTTADEPTLEGALRNRIIRPYSDFLLHDMGTAADQIPQGGAEAQEMRTAPLWGLRGKTSLWHDGRATGPTLRDRVLAAVAEHDIDGSEARTAAQSFLTLPTILQNQVIDFFDSLGRVEFDHDDDGDVDADDYVQLQACYTGPGSFYEPEDPCSISDVDQDGDVDDVDVNAFTFVADGAAGAVPDGNLIAGVPLLVARQGKANLSLEWSSSCLTGDVDYAVYEGELGDFTSHTPAVCSTGGETSVSLTPLGPDRYFLVVPTNGYLEGSYGADGTGAPRPISTAACRPQTVGACDGP